MDRRRILVVDDSGLVRQLAQMALDAIGGWDVLCAESGLEALERAGAEGPEARSEPTRTCHPRGTDAVRVLCGDDRSVRPRVLLLDVDPGPQRSGGAAAGCARRGRYGARA